MQPNKEGGIKFEGDELLAVSTIAHATAHEAETGERPKLQAKALRLAQAAANAYFSNANNPRSAEVTVDSEDIYWFITAAQNYCGNPRYVRKLRPNIKEIVENIRGLDPNNIQ